MIKLSELKDDELLLVGETVMTKEDLLNELTDNKSCGIKNPVVYTTIKYHAHIDANDMLDSALEYEYDNMYEDWYPNVSDSITKEDINELQAIVDRILERDKEHNISYQADQEVEIDMEV